jgi:acylphosphatase
VRNLADGRVELVGEGERAQLQRLVSDVKSKMGPYIGACDVQWAAATGEFGGFNVAY